VELGVAEGAFGAGPGDDMRWDNRLDIVLQARWNITDLFTARDRSRIAQSKEQQAQLSYQDLRAKLAMGVQESQKAVLFGGEQIRLGESQKEKALAAYKYGRGLFDNNPKQASVGNVLFAIKSQSAARFDWIRAVRNYDQAQLRLFILTGQVSGAHDGFHGPAHPIHPPQEALPVPNQAIHQPHEAVQPPHEDVGPSLK
jgi:hypothetical protein